MQDWLSISLYVLIIILISGFVLRYIRRQTVTQSNSPQTALPEATLSIKGSHPLNISDTVTGSPIIPRDKHTISRRNMSKNALKVLHRLNNAGYEAFLVGGCIRDLYLGITPKDFDIATSATPEEVRKLFKNARVIGRRFKLAHILFVRETIEVATFRASHDANKPASDSSRHADSGRILRDNVYGSMEEDALRRDFTINALYYESQNFSVVDYCNGVADIEQRTLRLIGDPLKRYREDPVRMLRAIRFAAKLKFTMAEATRAPIKTFAHLLQDIPPARLFDEALKLLHSGNGVDTFDKLWEYGLLKPLFPATYHSLESDDLPFEELVYHALESTDKRVRNNQPVTPAFLFAVLLWHPLQQQVLELKSQGIPPMIALQKASTLVLNNQAAHTAIPKRFVLVIREIWELQTRLERRQPRLVKSLLEHQRFRAAYNLLLLREKSGEKRENVSQWWTAAQEASDEDLQQIILALRSSPSSKAGNKNKGRKQRKSETAGDVTTHSPDQDV
ncbi:polynucleotide adenylyltransferase PcnB [Candidatus Sororendozoicomonas aggregata]|uniref:polynucleotide adenylyltransferase PcnB n=1 Tax=Candidatus Sororendozoicomonas aggregata TaxID=3073239 RepID=UPI002ED20CD7